MANDSYTPKQAEKNFCPQKFSISTDNYTCEGDLCMAWRWSQSAKTVEFSKRVIDVAKRDDTTWAKAHDWVLKNESDKFERKEGYCGLAGYPHNSVKP